jgi:PAS domain S-box-containing protein
VNILLVDDEPANLLALEAVLEELGQRLVQARSGEAALGHLVHEDFAVVLLDLQMPGLDGFETARLIRSRKRSRHTPIIFLTGRDSSDFPLVEAYKLGAVDYLVKPLVAEILRAKVAVFVELFQKARRLQHQAEQLHRAEQGRAERRALVQHAVAGMLAEAGDLTEALPRVLQTACEGLGWDAAGLWTVVREARVLRCTAFWHSRPAEIAEFEADSRQRSFAPGEGLPGRAWASGEPVWIEDVAWDDNFPRTTSARKAGLRGACALLIRLGRAAEAVGALEFFSRTMRPRDEEMLRALAAVGSQVGQSLERRRAEEELRASEQRFAGFMDHLPGLAWIKDLQGRYLYANDSAQTAFQAPRARLYGKTDEEVFPPETAVQFRENDRRALALGAGVQVIETLAHADGTVHHSLVNKFPIPGPGGEPALVGGMAIDITDRLDAEQALREAGRRKDVFLAMLGHELRNPLATLAPALQSLREGGADPEVRRESLDRMERQVRHLRRLVDDLLETSQLVHGRVRLCLQRLDLARLARTAAEDHRPALEGAGLALTVEAPETPLWISGDPTRLSQVVANLLDNAARYTAPRGRVAVAVAADAGRGQAVVRITDTGQGIAADLLPRLFRPFEQAEQGLERQQGGLGLGLAVVKGLVELHGGAVKAASEGPGRGAVFTVQIPLEREPEALTEVPHPSPARQSGTRILIVEDNPDAADSLRLLLQILGHEVRVARTGPDGVQVAAEWLPPVVISDIGLPGLDGYEMARRVRRIPGMENALLVALTGYGGEDDRRRSIEAGFDIHFVKPADPADLQRAVAVRVA